MHQHLPLAAILAIFTSLASTQGIDPSSVPIGTRQVWCQSQMTQCPLICLQIPGETSAATDANTCDVNSLTYDCVCANGQAPNASMYTQTLPYYICTQENTNCVNSCNGDNTCQSACVQNHPCGAQSPTRVNTSTSTTMSATGTGGASAVGTASGGGAVYSGFGGGSAATSAAGGSGGRSSAANAMLDIGQAYGLGIVFAGVMAGFCLL